jgi:energy-coupling factor transporter ATP-binding protein EcfA2
MLINFSVENFRSFGAEQTLNLIASPLVERHPNHQLPLAGTDQQLLRAGVVYGANGSGKSNLVKAIQFAQQLICGRVTTHYLFSGRPRYLPREVPSSFEFRLLSNGQIFVYGFRIVEHEVLEEWLAAVPDGDEEVEVFTREGQSILIGELERFGELGENTRHKLLALRELPPREDELLLTKILQLRGEDQSELLRPPCWWFTKCLRTVFPSSEHRKLLNLIEGAEDFRDFCAEFLQNAGTGITGLKIDRTEIAIDTLPQETIERLRSDSEPAKDPASISKESPYVGYDFDPDHPDILIRRSLQAQHRGNSVRFTLPMKEESDGTRRLLNLLPALYGLTQQELVFVIDELDRSMHPHLSYAFLKFFLESTPRVSHQLILTTHETHLLNSELLRRDEVWFVEKNQEQKSQLYSLVDFKLRDDIPWERGYLQGRFGAIPFIGDPQKLIDLLTPGAKGTANA